MSEPKFQMSINLQVLNHLGLNLYSNTSAVLSEVVANAWDADATEVNIQIDGNNITITDNGNGMNLSDINNKYLTVGYQKRSESGESPVLHRAVMGRKGIGKLSLFSIANIVEVYSQKDGEFNGFKIDINSLKEAIKANDTYYPVELPTNGIEFKGNGDSTKDVATAFNQLCEDLESLGEMEISYWALHLRGNKSMLKSRAKQIVMRAKILQEMINCYAD